MDYKCQRFLTLQSNTPMLQQSINPLLHHSKRKEMPMVTKRKVRFGVVGCGLMGREFAVASARWPALLDTKAQPEIVAICDLNEKLFAWYTDNFPSIKMATTNYHDLLAAKEVEAIYCAVPHNLHEKLYCDIVAAGKHLLGEKPFGIDL